MSAKRKYRSVYNGIERREQGYIATVVDRETGLIEVVSLSPCGRQELRDFCDELAARPGDWRIRTLSSPQTIWRDLQGSRDIAHHGQNIEQPELLILSQAGRGFMHEGRAYSTPEWTGPRAQLGSRRRGASG